MISLIVLAITYFRNLGYDMQCTNYGTLYDGTISLKVTYSTPM
jgi:hypothetical protein